jgi:type IV pilus assembly protein PilQ
MKKLIRFTGLMLLLLLGCITKSGAQERFDSIEAHLMRIGNESPGLFEKVELSVDGTSIQEFIRGLASSNNLNVSVEPGLKDKIYNNFTGVRVIDVFMFLVKKYDLDVNFIGNIIAFSQHVAPVIPVVKGPAKVLHINYDKESTNLDLDLSSDSLLAVVREITRQSQINVLCAPDIGGKIVNGFIQNTPLPKALNMMALANNLKLVNTRDNAYVFERMDAPASGGSGGTAGGRSGGGAQSGTFKVRSDGSGKVNVEAQNAALTDVINAVSNETKVQYFLLSELKGQTTMNIEGVAYEDFLSHILNATDYTFRKQGNVYLIGDRGIEGLRATKVIQLQSHEVQKIVDFIPADLKKNVDIKMFPDLSSLILCGSEPRINEIEAFIRQIDKPVPNISIEVMIVDINQSHTVSTGIEAGLGAAPATTGGTVFPSLNMTLSSSSINDIINGINGMGLINLGHVTPNFYINLKAMETQGILKIHSTPRVATINGQEAKMSISNTEYYLEQTNQQIVTQVAQNVITQVYKPVNAELAITVNPRVTGDEQVTLEITVKQSTFTDRISPTAPPGNTSRDFKSIIRVKNGEMIMLGGLEEETVNESGTGVPFLSRIPIIKWFFSSRTKAKSKDKLTIFIKPTVIY